MTSGAEAAGGEPQRMTAQVVGDVQGVGYRAFARCSAQTLGLRGYARNLPSGAVEVVAEGSRALLDQLVTALRRGPSFARVNDVRISWSEATGEFSVFAIR